MLPFSVPPLGDPLSAGPRVTALLCSQDLALAQRHPTDLPYIGATVNGLEFGVFSPHASEVPSLSRGTEIDWKHMQ